MAQSFLETTGEIELMSMYTEPGRTPSRMPSGPHTTLSTWGELGSIVMMMSQAAASCAGVAADLAPSATTSCTGSGLMSNTVREKPFLRMFLAIGLPMTPSPMRPICFDLLSISID